MKNLTFYVFLLSLFFQTNLAFAGEKTAELKRVCFASQNRCQTNLDALEIFDGKFLSIKLQSSQCERKGIRFCFTPKMTLRYLRKPQKKIKTGARPFKSCKKLKNVLDRMSTKRQGCTTKCSLHTGSIIKDAIQFFILKKDDLKNRGYFKLKGLCFIK